MLCSDAYRLGYNPVALHEQDARQKLKMKCRAESKGAIRECEIQVGDTVLVKQPRRGKLSTPNHPTPLIVTDKNQSMLTVEGPNSKVTRNSSHFKRFLTGEPITSFFDTLKESSTDVDMATRSLVFCTYFVSEVFRPWAY